MYSHTESDSELGSGPAPGRWDSCVKKGSRGPIPRRPRDSKFTPSLSKELRPRTIRVFYLVEL
eukprot:758827-Hanusia_phi.AAC.12